MSNLCPKCGAKQLPYNLTGKVTEWTCGSYEDGGPGRQWESEKCRTRQLKAEIERLRAELTDGWDMLMNQYGTDLQCELVDEDTRIEDVKITDGIQQLGDVAYQWRDRLAEADQIPEAMTEGGVDGIDRCHKAIIKQRAEIERLQGLLDAFAKAAYETRDAVGHLLLSYQNPEGTVGKLLERMKTAEAGKDGET